MVEDGIIEDTTGRMENHTVFLENDPSKEGTRKRSRRDFPRATEGTIGEYFKTLKKCTNSSSTHGSMKVCIG